MAENDNDETSKEPFVSSDDRPEVRPKADTPIRELRVRDLAALLGQLGQTRKDFWDGKDWIKDDFDGGGLKDKEIKEQKDKEKVEKNEKFEKHEKSEKPERKELKVEKTEVDGVFDAGLRRSPDPRLDQVIQALAGLTERVSQLSDQVEELKRTGQG